MKDSGSARLLPTKPFPGMKCGRSDAHRVAAPSAGKIACTSFWEATGWPSFFAGNGWPQHTLQEQMRDFREGRWEPL